LTPLTGVLFTFPSRYLFTIGRQVVFRLTRWSSQIQAELHVFRLTWELRSARIPVSATGLSPSMARLSRRLAYQIPVLNAVPQPRRSFLRRFGLFRFRSPLLAESSFLSFPRGTKMFHFPRFARTRLWIQRAVRRHYPPWVSPFGNLRIKAWLAAPRSLSQLPASFFASCRLGIHRVPFPAWSSSLLAPNSSEASRPEDQGPARSQKHRG
jgi:hypothetical protein